MNRRVLKQIFEFFKKYYNYMLCILVAVVTCYIIYTQVDLREFWGVIKRSNYMYLILAFGSLIIYWLMEAYMLMELIRFEYPDEDFIHAFSLAMIGQYYNQVTPSSSGGQPLQLIDMMGRGIKAGFATAVLVQKYALYQISVTVIGLIGCFNNIKMILSWPPLGKIMLIIGIGINLAGTIIILIIGLEPEYARKLMTFFVDLGIKTRLIKNPDVMYEKVDHYVSDYRQAIHSLREHMGQAIFLLIFNLLAIIVYYAITYFIYRAMGLSTMYVWKIILIQSILYLMIAFVPLPGAAGGAELGFAIVFGAIFGAAASSVALLTWRFITFYFILAFGAVYLGIRSLLIAKKPMKKLNSRSSEE